jgi:hypothetical protein
MAPTRARPCSTVVLSLNASRPAAVFCTRRSSARSFVSDGEQLLKVVVKELGPNLTEKNEELASAVQATSHLLFFGGELGRNIPTHVVLQVGVQ